MTVFITGGCKNGKSTFAIQTAMSLGEKRFYVATMLPRDEEDRKRIQYHRQKRAGLGFQTVESPCLKDLRVEREGVYLIDSVTALVQNWMFRGNGKTNPRAAEDAIGELERILEKTSNALFVSDYLYSNVELPAGLTAEFVENLGKVDRFLAEKCDKTVEICAGTRREWKQAERKEEKAGMEFVLGGAYQGKLEYAMEKHQISEEMVCFCDENTRPEQFKRCVYGLEHYLLGCLRRGEEPKLDFAEQSVVIMTDLFCGLVPVEEERRAWRELCGHAAAKIARDAAEVTRVFCGLTQSLKE